MEKKIVSGVYHEVMNSHHTSAFLHIKEFKMFCELDLIGFFFSF